MAFDLSQYANSDPHLSSGERAVSVLVGLGLTSLAAQPRPNVFLSMLALATGSYLAYRGATGYCPIKASLNDEHRHIAPSPRTRRWRASWSGDARNPEGKSRHERRVETG